MPREPQVPGSAQDWLIRANSDLALAKAPLPEGALYEDLCFHAQQAAEKAIKAVYRSRQLTFRYTHDLAVLLNGLRGADVEIPPDVYDAVDLTEFAWQGRYPTSAEPVAEAEYREMVALAERVVTWATRIARG